MQYLRQELSFDAALRDLQSKNPKLRFEAATVLGDVEPSEAAQAILALRPMLRDDRADVRYAAALSLGMLRDHSAIDLLVEQMTGDGHPMARQAAVIALGLIGDPVPTAALVQAIQNGPPDVRFQATTTLAQINPSAAMPVLYKALRDKDPEVRSSAASALALVNDKQAISRLRPLLDDAVAMVQIEAAMALATLGNTEGVAILGEALGNASYAYEAAEHLFHCTPKSLEPMMPKFRLFLRKFFVTKAGKVWVAGILARVHDPVGERKLQSFLRSTNASICGIAIQLLGKINNNWSRTLLHEFEISSRGRKWADEIHEICGNKFEE